MLSATDNHSITDITKTTEKIVENWEMGLRERGTILRVVPSLL